MVRPLGACLHAEDQVAGRELLWKLSLDADVPNQIIFYCELYLGYMGDSRVTERLKSHSFNPESKEYWGRTVALANLNDLDALRAFRDKLLDPRDEYETLFLMTCATRNCDQFKGCQTGPELIMFKRPLLPDRLYFQFISSKAFYR